MIKTMLLTGLLATNPGVNNQMDVYNSSSDPMAEVVSPVLSLAEVAWEGNCSTRYPLDRQMTFRGNERSGAAKRLTIYKRTPVQVNVFDAQPQAGTPIPKDVLTIVVEGRREKVYLDKGLDGDLDHFHRELPSFGLLYLERDFSYYFDPMRREQVSTIRTRRRSVLRQVDPSVRDVLGGREETEKRRAQRQFNRVVDDLLDICGLH